MAVEKCTIEASEDWSRLRQELWRDTTEQEHRAELSDIVGRTTEAVVVVRNRALQAIGFAETTFGRDYVNGSTTSPVGFREGIYVHPTWRRRGAARALYQAVEDGAAGPGCTELASDTDVENEVSQRMHRALGLEETERVVFYRKLLTGCGVA